MLKSSLKTFFSGLSLAAVWPCAATCWLEWRLHPTREELFGFWAQCFALGPGTPGMYLRRAFYRWTLDGCASDCYIGFGSVFSTRHARIESAAYVGTFALVGSVILRAKCLIGSRVSLLSGGQLHVMDELGNWLPTDLSRRQQIEIGENAWIGEGAIIMADVGMRAMVSAGAVVSAAVPERVMVAGNPARFVKRLAPPGATQPQEASDESLQRQSPVAAT
jgi:virginiamycin A acetyltransferase